MALFKKNRTQASSNQDVSRDLDEMFSIIRSGGVPDKYPSFRMLMAMTPEQKAEFKEFGERYQQEHSDEIIEPLD